MSKCFCFLSQLIIKATIVKIRELSLYRISSQEYGWQFQNVCWIIGFVYYILYMLKGHMRKAKKQKKRTQNQYRLVRGVYDNMLVTFSYRQLSLTWLYAEFRPRSEVKSVGVVHHVYYHYKKSPGLSKRKVCYPEITNQARPRLTQCHQFSFSFFATFLENSITKVRNEPRRHIHYQRQAR